ncbi:TPR-like protein [Serendipita vermifera]|nr:TPR-like protein [Serendipita vermifera]
MDKSKESIPTIHRALALTSNPVIGFASTGLSETIQPGNLTQSGPLRLDYTDVVINSSITSFKIMKESAEALSEFGGPIKATCGIMILVLETIQTCQSNREGWSELAEIMRDKNRRVVSLLELYAQAPEKYKDLLEQANKYQVILNEIASDMKKETETESDKGSELKSYWEKMKLWGREVALSEINAQKIASYRERLRDQARDTIEVFGVQIMRKLNEIEEKYVDHVQEKPLLLCKMALKPRPPLVDGFVGRDDILQAMRCDHFQLTPTRRNTPRVTVLTGLGGSGKTQIALKFASAFEEIYKGEPVYFLNASSKVTLEADLQTLVQSQSNAETNALTWLANTKRDWLVIMDNADDPSLELAQFLPSCGHGHIVITTRDHSRMDLAPESTHHVDGLPLDESITLLLNNSKYEDNATNRQLSKKIAQELGCLPLALAHAGAYIFRWKCLDTYLTIYHGNPLHQLRRRFDMPHGYPHSVARVIEMSFNKLLPPYKDLLGLLSHLDSRSIPLGIIEKAAGRHFRHVAMETNLPLHAETLQYADALRAILIPGGEWSLSEFHDMIEECEKYSLIQFSTQDGERFYSMHVLVQDFLRATCGVLGGHPSRRLVTRLLGSAVTIGDRWEYIAFNRSLSSHLRLIILGDVTEAGDHYGFGSVFEEVGEGKLAASHMERCIEIWRRSLNGDAEVISDAMELLALSYSRMGKEECALRLREEVVTRERRLLGDNHLKTLQAIGNLAASYWRLERNEESLKLDEEVLEKRRELLGDNHLKTLETMNQLVGSYSKLGRNNEALPLMEEVMKKRTKLLGDSHPYTLQAIGNLAVLYWKLGRKKDALPLLEEVVKKSRRVLGDDHFETLRVITNLAISYTSVGRHEEALQLDEEVVRRRRKVLGDDHPDTVQAIGNLAVSYTNVGRHEEALQLDEEVARRRRRVLGDDHPDTVQAISNLAVSYTKLGRYEEALPLDEEVVERRRKLFGDDHLKTIDAISGLAVSYSHLGKNEEACLMMEEVTRKRRRMLGDDHLDTLEAINNLAISYLNLEKDEEAVTLLELVVEKRRELLGDNSRDTLQAISNLAASYTKVGRHEEALQLDEEVVGKYRRVLGDDHLDTLSALYNLAISYLNLGRNREALPLLEEVVEKRRRLLSADHHDTLNAMNRLADLHSKLDRLEALSSTEDVVEKLTSVLVKHKKAPWLQRLFWNKRSNVKRESRSRKWCFIRNHPLD